MLRSMLLLGCVLVAAVAAAVIIYYNRRKTNSAYNHREPRLGINNHNASYAHNRSHYENQSNNQDQDDAEARLVRVIDARTGTVLVDRKAGINLIKKPTPSLNENEFEDENDDELESDPEIDETKPTNAAAEQNPNIPGGVIVMSVMASADQPYVGYELLQAMLSAGLRYGKMNIFHRYQQLSGNGPVLFSLASAVKPGTFELSKMGGYVTPGLTLFMQTNADKDLPTAFECMLDTARQLIDDLGGEIWDEERKPLSEEKINWWRMQLAGYEQNRHTADMFA